MKFKKEVLKEMLYDEHDTSLYHVVLDKIVSANRWSILNRLVFKYQDKFYESTYSRGATEIQDERPYEYEPDEIECKEVYEYEKVVKYYE